MTFKPGDRVKLINNKGNEGVVSDRLLKYDEVYTVDYETNSYLYLKEITYNFTGTSERRGFWPERFKLAKEEKEEDRYILVLGHDMGPQSPWISITLDTVMKALKMHKPTQNQITLMKYFDNKKPEYIWPDFWPFTIETKETVIKENVYKVKK